MKILIIANARWLPGMSGSDSIYLNFKKHWPCETDVWEMLEIDFRPFWLCYIWRILLGCWRALWIYSWQYDFVYSASDFWMDSLPAFIFKINNITCVHKIKWIAGFYLYAPKEKWVYRLTQKPIRWLINKFADIVCVTNASMFDGFKNKKVIAVNGGVDLTLAGHGGQERVYDAVFCGRIHHSKGIQELIRIWMYVRQNKPDATLALIGDYDLGIEYVKKLIPAGDDLGIKFFGYLEDERFEIYRQSKIVLYPSKVDHFSMSPVEAMACGCPMVCFNLPVMDFIKPHGTLMAKNEQEFAYWILTLLRLDSTRTAFSKAAVSWANAWDWKITTKKVYEAINENTR